MEKIEKFKSELLDDIFQYIQCISILVHKKKIYYLIDYKENFILNMKLDLDLDFKNGNITLEQYQDEMNSYYYRNGIWQLTKDNFESYLQSDSVIELKKDELKDEIIGNLDNYKDKQAIACMNSKGRLKAGKPFQTAFTFM